jgi:uncharacterized protein
MHRVHGIGLGLRGPLADKILATPPASLRWLEVSPENYMNRSGAFVRHLHAAQERFPLVTHGLTMSPGSVDPIDQFYMDTLAKFLRQVATPWHSDHLCFGATEGIQLHELLPIPCTHEALDHTVARVLDLKNMLDVPFALENISWYAHPGEAEIDETDFVREVITRADISLMLDVNNVYVNACNHGFDAREMLDRLPLDRVVQIHVAGHQVCDDGFRIDTHGERVCEDVYELLAYVLSKTGPVPVLLERDQHYQSFEGLCAELDRLDVIWRQAGETSL